MKITLESNIDDLEKKFEVSHDAYLMQTSEHMATFTALTKTDAQAARLIDMRLRKLQRLQVLVVRLLDVQWKLCRCCPPGHQHHDCDQSILRHGSVDARQPPHTSCFSL